MDLDGKVAIVTGASRGVGAATAVALAAAGARVACAARATDAQPLPIPGTIDGTVRTITDAGGDAVAVPTNLADDESVVAMVSRTVEHYGHVDILVNNAAMPSLFPVYSGGWRSIQTMPSAATSQGSQSLWSRSGAW